jgi:subtilisin-like proprotein convertase family protein
MNHWLLRHLLHTTMAVAFGASAMVMMSQGQAAAAGVPCQRTYSSGNINLPTQDIATVISEINVPEDGLVVSDVDISIDVQHTWDPDLIIQVISRTDANVSRGEVSRLFNRDGPGGGNLTGTTFDDDAATPISWGTPPFTGRFKPSLPLAPLNGFTGGKYELYVTDTAAEDSGQLLDWSVTLRYRNCDFDSDGVEDHVDQCPDVAAHTATGCPLTSRSVSATYKNGKFRGALSSPVAGCASGRAVTIWKMRRGPDRNIGTAMTGADGTYKLRRAKHAGKYYATSPQVVVAGVAECPAAQSPMFRIR